MANALCMLCYLFDADNLCYSGVFVVWYNCEWVFDVCNVCFRVFNAIKKCFGLRMRFFIKGIRPRPFSCGKGENLKRINIKLRVFDPGRLLVVRVGNLKRVNIKLRVFDPGRLLVVRVRNLKRVIIKLRVFDPGRLLVVRVGNLKRINIKLRVFVRPRLLTCGKGGELKAN